MASKITGAQVEYDPNQPLIDVDTAIEDLAEDLSRSGRRRQLIALQHLCAVARQVYGPWTIWETNGSGTLAGQREIERYDYDAHVILLVPQDLGKVDAAEHQGNRNEPGNDT